MLLDQGLKVQEVEAHGWTMFRDLVYLGLQTLIKPSMEYPKVRILMLQLFQLPNWVVAQPVSLSWTSRDWGMQSSSAGPSGYCPTFRDAQRQWSHILLIVKVGPLLCAFPTVLAIATWQLGCTRGRKPGHSVSISVLLSWTMLDCDLVFLDHFKPDNQGLAQDVVPELFQECHHC